MSRTKSLFGAVAAPIIRITAFAILAILLVSSVRYYQSDCLLTDAEHGLKTFSDYGSIIAKAAQHNDQAALRFSDYLNSKGNLNQAAAILHASSVGVNSWQGWEREGILMEKQGFTEDGKGDEVEKASQMYERVLEIYPTYQTGLQRIALLALKVGDWNKAYDMADKLDRNFFGNPEAKYIRAKAAEGEGDIEKQFALLQQLSVSSISSSSTLFTIENVHDQLKSLMSNSYK